MSVIGIDPNTSFIAYCVLSDDRKILDKGIQKLEDGLTSFLTNKIMEYNVKALAVEDFVYYGKVLNQYHIDTIKLIGRLQQYCEMRMIPYLTFSKPQINQAISRNKASKKATMQGFVKWYLGLKEFIRPQHVNDAVCVAIVGTNKIKEEEIQKKIVK